MTETSRTEYSARNTSAAIISQFLTIVMGYVTRIVFTHTLSESYVGINGLFTDILNVLALSELGVGTALTYALYKPIAEKDIERQKSLMRLFKWLYRATATIIAVFGLLILPFLGYLVKDTGDVEHIIPIYLLYLLTSVVSYLLVYKKALVDAYQRSYIGAWYYTVFLLLQYALQIVVLITTRNFLLFLLMHLLCTIGNNVSVARKADSLYPFLREKEIQPIPKTEKQSILKNMKAMLMHKIGDVVVNNTDNLLLTSMAGLVSAGKYSNYYLIIGSIRQVLLRIFQGITASVGNLGATEDREAVKSVFEASFFIGQWLYGLAGICLFQLLNDVIAVSFGENYLFSGTLVFVLCVNFFVTGMRQPTLVFRDSLGLFWHDRYKPLAEASINLAFSILLTLRFGIVGVFLGTFLSTMLTSFWVEPFVLYRRKLKSSLTPFFLRYALYTLVVLFAGVLTHIACRFVDIFVIKLLLCVAIPNLVFLLCYHRTREFRMLWEMFTGLVAKKFRRTAKEKSEEAAEATTELSLTDEALLELLRCALTDRKPVLSRALSEDEWDMLLQKAERHAVLSVLYDVLMEQPLTQRQREHAERVARRYVRQNYRLGYYAHLAVERLKEHGIPSVVLKGVSAASHYPTPELRKSGDIDLLLPHTDQLHAAGELLSELGFTVASEQFASHHLALRHMTGFELELHSMLVEPFEDAEVNKYIDACMLHVSEHIGQQNVLGYDFPVLTDGYQAYELLLHMLQHFLREGFGLRLLSDWVLFWNRPVTEDEVQLYLQLVQESGLSGFSVMITSVCVHYLGLDRQCCLCRQMQTIMEESDAYGFLEELLSAEEFGTSSRDRMVVLQDTSLFSYVRQFHHVTKSNFPRAGKVFLCWPVLWCITLFRFLRNNRRVRGGVSTSEILKKTKQRSKRMEQLELFKPRSGSGRSAK